MAFVSFCVPCALRSIVLTPPVLFPDYWLICPTCVISLPSSFAPFIISLCLQSCVSSSSYVVCDQLCPALPLGFPQWRKFFFLLLFFLLNKAYFLLQVNPRSIHSPHPDKIRFVVVQNRIKKLNKRDLFNIIHYVLCEVCDVHRTAFVCL